MKSANGKEISTAVVLFERRALRRPGECWGWEGYKNEKGYGVVRVGGRLGKLTFAHRLSWELNVGPIPPAMHVLHRCDNPSCTNPDHLFLGTNLDNIADRVAKGRPGSQARRGKPSPNRKLTPQQAEAIAYRLKNGERRGDLAREYGVTAEHIWRVGTGRAQVKSW